MGTTAETIEEKCRKGYAVAGKADSQSFRLRLFRMRTSQGRLKALVNGDLVTGNEFVGFVGHADDLLKFLEHIWSHTLTEGRSGVGIDAVLAIVGDAYGDVNEFLGEWVNSARTHDGFQIVPSASQQRWIVSDGFPEIIDVIGFACGHDVVVDGFHFWDGVLVFDQTESGHADAPKREMSAPEC